MSQRFEYEDAIAGGLKGLATVHHFLGRSAVPRTLLDLVYLRASQINGCAYCIDLHAADLRAAGVDARKLLLVSAWREAGAHFDDDERAALAWTEVVTLVAATQAPDADYQAAVARFGEARLAQLTLAIGLINVYNRVAVAFRRGPAAPAPLQVDAAPVAG